MGKLKKLIVTLLVIVQVFVFCAAAFADSGIVHKQGYNGSLIMGVGMFAAILFAIFMFLRRKIDD